MTKSVVFIDTEVSVDNKIIHDIGAVRGTGLGFMLLLSTISASLYRVQIFFADIILYIVI